MNVENDTSATDIESGIRDYYGETLHSSQDLRTSACCSAQSMPPYLRDIHALLHAEVKSRFYGCASGIGEPQP